MLIRNKTLSWLFVRQCLGVPFGIWLAISVAYYWWLISRISVLENQNKMFRSQLQLSQTKDSLTTFQIPVLPEAYCETIHVALICMQKCTRQVTPMLKSLLHHRQNPVHFHFVVDADSERIMNKLMQTWDLPDVKYTCYNAQDKLSQVKWIQNSHYSGIFALVKLLFPEIMPPSLNQIIVLDSDLTFLSDIAELWAMFRNMTDEEYIGLVENESDWYGGKNHWPALGRGFNTGVMLLDLRKIRADVDWTSLWHSAVNRNMPLLKETMLADQDIINAIIEKYPRIVYNVNCQYNVQMSMKSLAKNCYGQDRNNVKIIHWNSPYKYNIKIKDAPYFSNIHQSYVNLDGNLLRQKLYRCSEPEVTTVRMMNNSDLCQSFRAAQRAKLRTHIYYKHYSHTNVDNFDITLVLQLSMDRLQFLERLVRHWDGPLSAAIYLSDCELSKFESFINEWSDTLSARTNVGYHLVFKVDSVRYPVNYLRNVALEHVTTPYVFLMDADFVPGAGLYKRLRSATQLINPYPQRKCLVVPAFETQSYRASPPRTKLGLLDAVQRGDLQPFRLREWPRGHRATNYTKWYTASAPYEVEWQADYEPYLVVHRSVPKYDTRFSGFGWNKVSHSVELRAQGYRPVVLPDAFVVHTAHAPSRDISAFRADLHYRICLALLKQEFMDDLKRKYNVTFKETEKPNPMFLAEAKRLSRDNKETQ